ncbi:peptidase C69 [Betaproteobacteria bacterium]|nr:peptidase C69 [Betaproteobacteria bacterium]GHU45002.1 peptidase C69 [Betaproteobacteria bacterium]
MADKQFSHSFSTLQQLAADALAHARKMGATAAGADVSEGCGQSVTVRCGEVETIEYNRDKGLSVSVYLGKRRGYASTSDFSPRAVRETVEAALAIARFTAEDPCSGLPEAEWLALGEQPDLDLYHPWDLSTEDAIALAARCEAAAFAADKRVDNSEGGSVSSQQAQFVSANSLGFMGGYPTSRHYIACSVIAGRADAMQRDDWYSTHRNAKLLETPESIGAKAAARAVARLGAKKIGTGSFSVLFEAPLAAGLLGHFVQAASGGALYRKASFLVDSLGQALFPDFFNLSERPHLSAALASCPFDNEGVRTRAREVVQNGVLQGYFLNVYSGRKLGLPTTANAGGSHNLILQSGGRDTGDLATLVRRMGRGLLVTELLGHGVNYVTGDYSRGAAGFWVENGEIAHPVEEITIAGNLRDMFKNIRAIGSDVERRGSRQTGSILIEGMTVAG